MHDARTAPPAAASAESKAAPPSAGLSRLGRALAFTCDCPVAWEGVESVRHENAAGEETVHVHAFRLFGHPSAGRAFAWLGGERGPVRIVLAGAMVRTPRDALRRSG